MSSNQRIGECAPGTTLGHYHILEKIGAGGMGEVFRAQDEHLDREVAIKVLPPGTFGDKSARKRFHKEALALSKFNHPNIATIHDFDTQNGRDFLVMEYIPGAMLNEKLRAGPLGEKEIVRLGLQLTEGLEAAHAHAIVHRDLKPGNVRITPDGRLKILDFGLAKLVTPNTDARTASLSETPKFAGTLLYMAPEQLTGDPIDARTDIHAAGVLLYEMATGQHPFAKADGSQLIGAILRQAPMAISQLNSKLSPELQRVIGKCLEKDPEHRYQSAKEIRVDLGRLALSTSSRQATGVPRRSQRWLGMAVLLLLAVLALAPRLYRYVTKPRSLAEPKQVLVADFENRTGDPDFDDSLRTALSTYLEQSRLVNIFPLAREHAAVQALGRSPDARIDANLGSQICVREGIALLITGEISRLKDQYVLVVRIQNPENQKVLSVHSVPATEKNAVLAALGSMARELRSDIGEQRVLIEQNDKLLEQVTTGSLPALHLYALARKEHLKANFEVAIPLYKNALRLDADFALAYARLSTVYRDLGDTSDARLYMNKALKLLDRVTDRERYTLLGLNAAYEEDYEQAIDNFLVLTKVYPDDSNGHFYLALCYLLKNDLEHANTEARTAAALDPSPFAYNNLAEVLLAQNRFQEVIDLLKVSPTVEAEGGLARAYLGLDQPEKAQEAVSNLLVVHDERIRAQAAMTQVEVWLFSGQWRQVEKFLNETVLVGADRYPLQDLTLAALAIERADYSRARQLLGNAERKVSPSDAQYLAIGVLLSAAHERRLSQKVLLEIETRLASRKVRRWQAYDNLMRGALALYEGHPKRALPLLKSARADWDDIWVRSVYAQALFESAQLPEAQKEFEGVLEQRGRALGDPAALILWKLSRYWIGRSRQAQGDAAGSRLMYQAFLGGWPSTDQDWLATQDAARRLRQLE
jgi:eukaryotic-like serine/threonine-protein kinase